MLTFTHVPLGANVYLTVDKALLPTKEEPMPVDASNQAPPPKLVRRRSMAVPGLATRNPLDILRRQNDKPAAPVQKNTHLRKVEELLPTPQRQIPSLEVPHDDRPHTRAQTPGDMDYATLSNKIGTLMITNGAPSPAPSVISRHLDRKSSLPDLHREGYFALSAQGRSTSDKAIQSRPPPPRRIQSFAASSGCHELDGQSTEIPEMPRLGRYNELMLMQQPSQENSDHDVSLHPTPEVMYGDGPSEKACADGGYHGDIDNIRAEALRMLDGSVAAAPTQSHEKSPIEQPSPTAPNTGFKFSLANGKLARPAQVLHSDSGYSSGASLKAVQRSQSQACQKTGTASAPQEDDTTEAASTARDPREYSRALVKPDNAANAEGLYTIEGMPSLPCAPAEELSKQETATETKADTKAEWRKSLRRSKSWKRISLKSLTSPSPSPTVVTPEATDSKELGSEPAMPTRHDSGIEQKMVDSAEAAQPARKKLQKRKSLVTVPTVQNLKAIDTSSIPSIPTEVSAVFSKRIEESPGVDHLQHTCASVTSFEQPSGVSIRFPSPTPTEDVTTMLSPSTQSHPQKRPSKAKRTHSPLKYAFTLRRKPKLVPVPLKEAAEMESEVPAVWTAKASHVEPEVNIGVTTISDFGTVAQSLGGSPYDIALSTLPVRPQVSASSAVQPHHFSTAMIEPVKSGNNMDAATASAYARMRSKDRLAAADKKEEQQKSQTLGPSENSEDHTAAAVEKKEQQKNESNIGRIRSASFADRSYQQQWRTTSGIPTPNFSRPQSLLVNYHSNNSSTSDLANKQLPLEPSKHTQPYKPYRRGLLVNSFAQNSVSQRAATFDIREEKIPATEEDEEAEEDFRKRAIARRHTEKVQPRPSSADEKMVVELEEDIVVPDYARMEKMEEPEREELPLPPSLRISTSGWEQTSKLWRERRQASQNQGRQFHSRSQSVRPSTRQQQQQSQLPEGHHLRSQSAVVQQQRQLSLSPPSSASTSARQSPAPISPCWSPVPQEISSPVKPLPNPFAAASARSPSPKKRSSIQRYYSTINKNHHHQRSKTEAIKEEENAPAVPPK